MLLIFDWDGTLCDSTGRIVKAMQDAAAKLGFGALEDHEILEIIGLSLPAAIQRIYPELSESDCKQLREEYSVQYLERDRVPSAFFPQVQDTLDELRAQGHILTVATGKSRRGLDRVMAGMDLLDYFDGSRCADETASKPHPKMVFELLDVFDTGPEDAIVVGDTEFDMEMALNAKVPRVGVSYGAHSADRLHKYDLKACLDNFDELLKHL
ncbi:MAG: HAD-IA family hydrolase [Cellvibrionaceae bacterium]